MTPPPGIIVTNPLRETVAEAPGSRMIRLPSPWTVTACSRRHPAAATTAIMAAAGDMHIGKIELINDGDADGRRRRAPLLLFRSQLSAQARIRFKPYILMRSGGDRPAPVHPMAPANHTMHGEVDRCIDGPRQPRSIELIDVEDG